MKKVPLQILCIFLWFSPLFSQQNGWTKKANFFEARDGAASFIINNKLYVGTGSEKADLWEYDAVTNGWLQKANLPAPGRSYAVGFTIGNKGYIATGTRRRTPESIMHDSLMRDVWEYDPTADNWTKKADFGGAPRARAVAFVLNKKAYLGSGENVGSYGFTSDLVIRVASDFWTFDPVADKWQQVADIPMRRMNAIAFSNNGSGFVGTGFYNTYTRSYGLANRWVYPGDNLQDLWAYDPASNTWVKKSDFPGGKRMGMSVFTIGDSTYTIAGAQVTNKLWPSASDILKKEVWAYNNVTDTWVQKPDFPSGQRRYTIAAATAVKAYVGTGGVNDLWEYIPKPNLLPVTLISFTGAIQNNKTRLEWMIEHEQNLDHYEVYKSLDGTLFNKSGEVKAVNKKQYTYEDAFSPTSQKLYYRLRIIDQDGSFNYSKIVTVINSTEGVHFEAFYPSPLSGNTGYLNITCNSSQKLQVVVTDIAGNKVLNQAFSVSTGSNKISLTFGKLAPGTYQLRVIDGKNVSHAIQFIKN